MDPIIIVVFIVVLLIGAFVWYKNNQTRHSKEFEARLQQLPESERQAFIAHKRANQGHTMDNIAIQMQRLKSPNKDVRYEACEELRVASTISQEAIAALEEATRDLDREVADAARDALATHRSRASEPASGATYTSVQDVATGPRKHSGCLTAFLALAVVGNAFLAILTWAMTTNVPASMQGVGLFAGFLNLAGVGFAIAIYKWKKWGLYGYVACIGMTILLNLILGDLLSAGRGLLPVALLAYLIRPSWGQMD